MPENLITSVEREIDRLKKEIGERTSELAALKSRLTKHQKAHRLLAGRAARGPRPAARRSGRARKGAGGDWNAMLADLPSRFTVADLTKKALATKKSSTYVRQVAVRWLKQKKTKRIGRGEYQKI